MRSLITVGRTRPGSRQGAETGSAGPVRQPDIKPEQEFREFFPGKAKHAVVLNAETRSNFADPTTRGVSMGFVDAIKSGFSNYVNFQGRARRSEYWFWFLFTVLLGIVANLIDGMLGMYLLAGLATLATILPSIAVGVRRLHDTGRSGFWLFIALVPLVGAIVLIIFFIGDSAPGANKYGPNPKGA
jgi:uncharacterized membrane protein YhaH (DUF805 family)